MADPLPGVKAAKTAAGQTAPESTILQILVNPFTSGDLKAGAKSSNLPKSESVDSRILRYIKHLPEFGYWPNNNINPKIFEIDVEYFRDAMYDVLTTVLIDRICGLYKTRYLSPPSYSNKIELPLPFALAIQEFGHFTTHSLQNNYLMVPTYPENTRNEGRASYDFPAAEYQSYIPTLKRLGIEMKSVDNKVISGSPWWTFKVLNLEKTPDLVCTLPRSHYSDLDAVLRSVFCFADHASGECKDVIKLPADTGDYGTLMHCMKPGLNARSFLALINDGTEE
ncbi:hypothetical protein LXL04_012122 [Taraxacum kok-saghyz]